jgi:hypothetical protein
MATTRVTFQNSNVFVAPGALSGTSATGAFYTSGNSGQNLVAQLANVQSVGFSFSPNRQDINILGQQERTDSVMLAIPTVSMDFSYLLTNGYNEYLLGFSAKGGNFISGLLTKRSDTKNFFISLSDVGEDDNGVTNPNTRDVYAISNGAISNYTLNAAVGEFPTASVTVDALNAVAYTGSSGLQSPAINTETQARVSVWNFQLPVAQASTGAAFVTALRPGDITLSFPSGAGFMAPVSGSNSISIQSVSFSVPIGLTVLEKLGAFYPTREIQPPINVTMSVRALASDIQQNSLDSLLSNDAFYDFGVRINKPGTTTAAINVGFNRAKLSSYSQSVTTNGNATIDLSYVAQLGGAMSTAGFTLSGYGVT